MKKFLKSIVFALCACLCACVFVACDDDKTGGNGGEGTDGGNSGTPTASRTWKQILQSDDMKTITVAITSTMTAEQQSMESQAEYKRDNDKYICKSEFTEYGTNNKTTITEYYERAGEKMYIYHTSDDNKVYKSEVDAEGRYSFDYGSESGSKLGMAFGNIKTVEGLFAKAVAEESKFDAGTDEDGAKAYKCEGDIMDFYLAMTPDSEEEAPEGVTITGNVKIFVKDDKVVKIVFSALMKNGQYEQQAEMVLAISYATGEVTLPAVTPAE